MRKRATRQDVAHLAGVSPAVVSYVINNGPRPVSEVTRKRVLEAIKETGYIPNRVAQALAQGDAKSIGLLIPNVTNPFLAELTQAIGAQAFAANYALLLADSADEVGREAELVDYFMSQQLSAFVWYTVNQPAPIALLSDYGLPTVILNATEKLMNRKDISLVYVNETEQGRIATEHLIKQGCKRIGMITGPEHRINSQARCFGWRTALNQANLADSALVFSDFTENAGYQALNKLSHCDGIVTSNERQAIGVLAAAYEAKIRIPQELKVVAINGSRSACYTNPTLTTVDQSVDFLAKETLNIITAGSRNITDVPIELKIRQSTQALS